MGQKAVIDLVSRRRKIHRAGHVPGLLWAMALLGLLLLPSDFRAGADTAHAHSIVQLWADARDGVVEHHHHGHAISLTGAGSALDWLDPAFGVAESVDPRGASADDPDVAGHSDSVPTTSGVQFLLAAALTLPAAGGPRVPIPARGRPLLGRSPRIPLPPPRSVVAAV
jgi:hypothetical protein